VSAKTGTEHHFAKLTPKLVTEMREQYACGDTSILDIACEFDVSYTTAREALNGTTWKSVPAVIVKTCPSCSGKGRVPA